MLVLFQCENAAWLCCIPHHQDRAAAIESRGTCIMDENVRFSGNMHVRQTPLARMRIAHAQAGHIHFILMKP